MTPVNPPEPPIPFANLATGDDIPHDTCDRCGGAVLMACGARCERCGFPRQCGL